MSSPARPPSPGRGRLYLGGSARDQALRGGAGDQLAAAGRQA
jgi:hypothetical protein